MWPGGRIRHIDRAGVETVFASLEDFAVAVMQKRVTSDDLVFDSQRQRWCPAVETEVFRAVNAVRDDE